MKLEWNGEADVGGADKEAIAVTAEDIGFADTGGTAPPYGHTTNHEQQEIQEHQDTQENQSTLTGQSGERPNVGASEWLNSMPLNVAVRHAHTSARIQSAEPLRKGNTPMFSFARMLKGHPELASLSSEDAAQMVEGHLRAFDSAPLESGVWEWAFRWAGTEDEILLDFQHAWDNIRHVPGVDVLADALRLADQHPFQTEHKRSQLYCRFVAMAYQLQKLNKERVIMLPVEKVATMLGCTVKTVSHLRHFAERDGYLVKSGDHSFGRKGVKNKATEFRFNLQ
ncbi:MAG: hypothetical protein ABSD13_05095 [Candidatus Korobacteraceae bacterium]